MVHVPGTKILWNWILQKIHFKGSFQNQIRWGQIWKISIWNLFWVPWTFWFFNKLGSNLPLDSNLETSLGPLFSQKERSLFPCYELFRRFHPFLCLPLMWGQGKTHQKAGCWNVDETHDLSQPKCNWRHHNLQRSQPAKGWSWSIPSSWW